MARSAALQLPPGSYDLIIEPPRPSIDGLTAIREVLVGAATWTLALAKPVPLTGRVTGMSGSGVAGARVTAIETVGLGAAPSTLSAADGRYSVMVDKGAPLQLLVEPAAGDRLAGTRLPLARRCGPRRRRARTGPAGLGRGALADVGAAARRPGRGALLFVRLDDAPGDVDQRHPGNLSPLSA